MASHPTASRKPLTRLVALLVSGVWLAASRPAALAAPVDFEREIRPLLAERCLGCHGPEKHKGGLRLDLKQSALQGGDSGEAAVVPGASERSRLFELVRSRDDSERMPPRGKPLSPAEVELLQRWIDAGASWPEAAGDASAASTSSRTRASASAITDEDRDHWAFRVLKRVEPPSVNDVAWIRTPVDRFIRHAQEAKGLKPVAPAASRTLVRRATFDLVGLPPGLDGRALDLPSARVDPVEWERLVENLLASPQYGERWARHWLDVARYADSDGQEGDADRPNAYRFRDFVIRALNDDLPFDTFVRWQLAGDEIEPGNPLAIAATGFIVAGNSTKLNVPMEEEKLRNRANELDDMISTTGQALLGLTLACARCHDHKYDAIPTRDYYRLMRVFNSGDRTDVPLASPSQVKAQRARRDHWKSRSDAAVKRRDAWLAGEKEALNDRVRAARIARLPIPDKDKRLLREKPDDPAAKELARRFRKELKAGDSDYVAALSDVQKQRWEELDGVVRTLAAEKPRALPEAFAFADFGPEPRETWFFERGDFLARNERMDLGFLSVLTRGRSPTDYWDAARRNRARDDSTQQRRALADWITDLDHGAGALLARVMANRVWQHHFGEGLVRTVSDFGVRGEPPTHPDLLEWLAGEFVRSGWSLKHLHRLIVTSATYQLGTAPDEANFAIDPDNRLLWRRRPRRLEAESLRDAMLAVAGSLNPAMFGPSFKPPIPAEAMQARNVKNPYPRDARDTPETRRRTIYAFHKRVVQYPLSQAFDAPDAQVSCGRRVNTTVAPQALALLNDPFVRIRAEELAGRLRSEAGDDPASQVRLAFRRGLGRPPEPDELEHSCEFLDQQTSSRHRRETRLSVDQARMLALTDFCQMLFSLNEFIYID